MTTRAVFLDRDGVLNRALIVEGKSYPPADADSLEIVPDAPETVAALKRAGYLCICVTNQPDVARGTRTLDNVMAMNAKVAQAVGLDDLYMCTHDNADNCTCRKPQPGMLLAAARKWRIDLRNSWMLGDRATDVAAGKAAGCHTILIGETATPEAEHTCATLRAAQQIIIR